MKNSKKIWILEDDPGCQMVYQDVLDLIYTTSYFTKIGELKKNLVNAEAKSELPDLLIIDLKLKDGHFTDYLNTLEDQNFNYPFIVVSTNDNMDTLRWCRSKGALDYMVKPFNKSELLLKLEGLLKVDFRSEVEEYIETQDTGLTPKEIRIIKLFLRSEKHLNRLEIMKGVWSGTKVHENNVNVHISSIKDKLSKSPYSLTKAGNNSWEFRRV
jgi:DNA-binding response OmpR family regulator